MAQSNKQQWLFEAQPAPWDLDEASEHLVASVLFPSGPPKELDYLVPDALREALTVGKRVRAPLGRANRGALGYCVKLGPRETNSHALKTILEIVDEVTLISPRMLELTRWIADYYLCSWAQVLEAVVPAAVRSQAGTRLTTFLSVSREVRERLSELHLPSKQAQVLACLASSPQPLTPIQLSQAAPCAQGTISLLRRKGLIASETRRLHQSDHREPRTAQEPDHVLNDSQQAALDAILAALYAPRYEGILMFGVTGSGKTEVYIRAIQEVVRFGRQAIVLVPEISLTPQAKERFRARFGEVAVLHSHLTDAERHWQWARIARGEVQVVVGARSAVFAPTPHLGLIVLDEEHEASFKQDSTPRYHAREVAFRRAQAEGIPLVLGSATPSLESWHAAQTREYRLVELAHRVGHRPLPDVLTIDLRNEYQERSSRGAISRPLHLAMTTVLESEGQVILLLNRRGFSTHIQCPVCSHVVRCEHCDIALTHHRDSRLAICHYCDFQVSPPARCPECRFEGIRYGGLGTQRLEAEVRSRFPGHACLRMDTDTMQAPGSHERALSAFRAGDVRILLGTQMIAKGLDFPNVMLVGVINADTALYLPDFRAAERTFQLLVQVAGRTGRGPRGGRVLVQTLNPDHPAIIAAVRHDFRTFCAGELPSRQSFLYPPYGSMVRVVVRGPVEIVAREFADEIRSRVQAALADHSPENRGASVRILGPATAPLARLRGNYRFHLLLQSAEPLAMQTAITRATRDLKPPENVQWIVDVDAMDML